MRRVFQALCLAVLVLILGSHAVHAQPSMDRQELLLYRLKHDCGSCHGMTLKGGLGPSLLPEALVTKSDDVLAEAIIRGLPGTPMPPWGFEISRSEALWLVNWLRNGGRDVR